MQLNTVGSNISTCIIYINVTKVTSKVGIFQDGWWYLDSDGSYAWNTGDKSFAWGSLGTNRSLVTGTVMGR